MEQGTAASRKRPRPRESCEICGKWDKTMAKCTLCSKCYHLSCFKPPLSKLPAGWVCGDHQDLDDTMKMEGKEDPKGPLEDLKEPLQKLKDKTSEYTLYCKEHYTSKSPNPTTSFEDNFPEISDLFLKAIGPTKTPEPDKSPHDHFQSTFSKFLAWQKLTQLIDISTLTPHQIAKLTKQPLPEDPNHSPFLSLNNISPVDTTETLPTPQEAPLEKPPSVPAGGEGTKEDKGKKVEKEVPRGVPRQSPLGGAAGGGEGVSKSKVSQLLPSLSSLPFALSSQNELPPLTAISRALRSGTLAHVNALPSAPPPSNLSSYHYAPGGSSHPQTHSQRNTLEQQPPASAPLPPAPANPPASSEARPAPHPPLPQESNPAGNVTPSASPEAALAGGTTKGTSGDPLPNEPPFIPNPDRKIINFSLKPSSSPPVATLSGLGMWGESFSYPLSHPFAGFFIGRKSPDLSLDLGEHTDTRTVSHKHCGIIFNKALNRFELENYGRNGTKLNGNLLGKNGETKMPLKNGDVIEVGKVKLYFRQQT